jgi:hypothetical protein
LRSIAGNAEPSAECTNGHRRKWRLSERRPPVNEWRPDVSEADLAAVLREQLEAMIPPHRRALDWVEKWEELEAFAERQDAEG